MKKILLLLMLLFSIIGLTSCDDEKEYSDHLYLTGDYNLAKNISDGVILHAWNWSYNTIKENLENIAESGFSAVQTSPVQQPKQYNGSTSVMNTWWKLYQPVSFTIGNAWLGSKEELTSLCTEAEKYGIKIICDIVVNHMANVNDFTGYHSDIETYEPTIFSDTDTYFHPYKKNGKNFGAGDGSIEAAVRGSLSGLPDLNTGNEYVQERVISLLKECIDCGVSGFRFDAAKHIETPDDGEFASNFWPNVLGASTSYANETYQRNMYYYGEILNTPGKGRSIESYTKYMSFTDNGASGNIYSRVLSSDAEGVVEACQSLSFDVEANKVVLWTESHDTYADGVGKGSLLPDKSTKYTRCWSIVANKKGSTALYFARPGDANMGECGTYYWMSQEITAINQFHNAFINASENYKVQKGYVINERYRDIDGKAGVIITNIGNSKQQATLKDIKVDYLEDGTYYDQISNNKFTVKKGKLSGNMSDAGIVILYDKKVTLKPIINATQSAEYFFEGESATLKLDVKNANKVYYTKNDSTEKIEVATDGTITVNEACTITVYAEGAKTVTAKYKFETIEKRQGYWCVAGLTTNTIENKSVYAWVWTQANKSAWREVEIIDGVAYIKKQTGDYGLLLVAFEKGHVPTGQKDWDLAPTQTDDFGKPLDENVIYNAGI